MIYLTRVVKMFSQDVVYKQVKGAMQTFTAHRPEFPSSK